MLEQLTGQVEPTPGGATPYSVFFLLHGYIIGEVGVHTIEEGEAIIQGAFEYLERIRQEGATSAPPGDRGNDSG